MAVREFVGRRDDDTLLYSFAGPLTIKTLIYQRLPYDPARDLVPIASTTDNFLVIAASAALNVRSLRFLHRSDESEKPKELSKPTRGRSTLRPRSKHLRSAGARSLRS